MMKEGTSLVERVEWKVLGKKGDSTFRETRDTNVDTIKGGKANPFCTSGSWDAGALVGFVFERLREAQR
jgi:hypothetical protein